jgi:prepilin-type N-terminal cleavage/methylation domain-containing protein
VIKFRNFLLGNQNAVFRCLFFTKHLPHMQTFLRQRAVRGFTLIELLIVVIIIAILAAIAIPQFSSSSKDAQEAALDANLATVRSSIELYRVQHANVYPGVNVSSGGPACTGGDIGKAAALSKEAVNDQLTAYSNAAGATCTVKVGEYTFGPYLRAIPAEPFGNEATILPSNAALAQPAAVGKGWLYSTLTGQFIINTNAVDSKNKAYSTR